MDVQIFEAMPGTSVLLLPNEPTFTIVAATGGYILTSGRTKEQLLGKGIFEAFPINADNTGSISEKKLRLSFQTTILNKTTERLPLHRYDIKTANGILEECYWSAVNKPLLNDDGDVIYLLHTVEDVTEQVKAGKMKAEHLQLTYEFDQLKESEEKYRSLFSSITQGFCVIELLFDENNQPVDYCFLETNPVFEEQTGLKDAIGKTANQLVPNLDAHWFQLYGKVAQTGESIHFIEGSEAMGRWFDVFAIKVGGAETKKVALLFTDITERNKIEKALKLNESNLRNIIMQAPVAMAILKGPQFVVELANDFMYQLWGAEKEALLGKSIFVGLPEVRNQGYEELLNGVYTTGERFIAHGYPVSLPRKGGVEIVYVNFLYEAFREPDGSVSGLMVVATDVTEQVTARMKVEASHKEFQFVTDFLPQLIWVTLPDGYHYYYNKQWYDYTGLTPGDSEGDGWNSAFHPDDQERAWNIWRDSLSTGKPYEIEYRCRRYDGEYRWFLGRALPLKDETGAVVKWFGTCTDIDDQKRGTR